MIYQCIKCKKKWTNGNDDITIDTKEISHGLCEKCLSLQLKPIYKKKQLLEGNFDCYGTFMNYCDQFQCSYRKLCEIASNNN